MEEVFRVSGLGNQLNDGTPYKATDQGEVGQADAREQTACAVMEYPGG